MNQYRQIPLGALPDRQDRRDLYKNRRYSIGAPPILPSAYFLSYLPPIKDQKQTESCTGHSAAYFAEAILASRSNQYVKLAPFFVWYYARLAEGTQTQDTGVQMRSIMDSLHTAGICPESFWPAYPNPAIEPNEIAKINALFKLPIYERCETLQDIKYSLAIEKQPVCVGVEVMDTWYEQSVQGTGIIRFDANSKIEGGHAVTCVGYDDNKQLLKFANSWGISYGENGFFYLPYAYLTNTWFDAWTAGYDTIPQAI